MTTQELIAYVRDHAQEQATMSQSIVEIPDEIFWTIGREQAKELAATFGTTVFLRLPLSERKFFTWLREAEPLVWEDLWAMDFPEDFALSAPASDEDRYLVGIGLLEEMVYEARGFPICDLTTQPNFFFSIKNFNAEEIKPLVDAVLQRMEDKIEMSVKEILLMEIRRAPIDVWRFAYFYRVPVEQVKAAALDLVEDGLMRYAGTREEMSDFLEW
jgi:hypothetical protein